MDVWNREDFTQFGTDGLTFRFVMPVKRGECFEDKEPFCHELKYLACVKIKIQFFFTEWLISNFIHREFSFFQISKHQDNKSLTK